MTNLNMHITTAPCCWGGDEASNPYLPHWLRVLEEASLAGYIGLEVGPYGYIPQEINQVSEALGKYNLFIVAGTIFNDLVSLSNRKELLKQVDDICRLISKLPKAQQYLHQHYPTPYLIVIDWGHDNRDYAAWHSDKAERLSIDN